MNPIRRIKLPNLYNFRDLGGYETGDGRVTKWNRLYRCDCPSRLTESEWQAFRDRNIRTLIDLRSSYEAWEEPVSPPDDLRLISCHFFREEEGADLKGEAGKRFMASLSIDYCVMAETSIDRIALILKTIAGSMLDGNSAFFCSAGKDRTGIIAAEILKLCGVSDRDIISDYAVTEIYIAEVIKKKLDSLPKEILAEISPETMEAAAFSKPETMERYLKWSAGFGFLSQMEKNGFSKELQGKLTEALSVQKPGRF